MANSLSTALSKAISRSITRREWLNYSSALLAGSAFAAPLAQASQAHRLGNELRIVIPANPGGGWDQTGRALGAALTSSGMVDKVGRIQTRSATPVDSVNEGGVLRAVDQQFSVHSQR